MKLPYLARRAVMIKKVDDMRREPIGEGCQVDRFLGCGRK
jgi:hypothetical protein